MLPTPSCPPPSPWAWPELSKPRLWRLTIGPKSVKSAIKGAWFISTGSGAGRTCEIVTVVQWTGQEPRRFTSARSLRICSCTRASASRASDLIFDEIGARRKHVFPFQVWSRALWPVTAGDFVKSAAGGRLKCPVATLRPRAVEGQDRNFAL